MRLNTQQANPAGTKLPGTCTGNADNRNRINATMSNAAETITTPLLVKYKIRLIISSVNLPSGKLHVVIIALLPSAAAH